MVRPVGVVNRLEIIAVKISVYKIVCTVYVCEMRLYSRESGNSLTAVL